MNSSLNWAGFADLGGWGTILKAYSWLCIQEPLVALIDHILRMLGIKPILAKFKASTFPAVLSLHFLLYCFDIGGALVLRMKHRAPICEKQAQTCETTSECLGSHLAVFRVSYVMLRIMPGWAACPHPCQILPACSPETNITYVPHIIGTGHGLGGSSDQLTIQSKGACRAHKARDRMRLSRSGATLALHRRGLGLDPRHSKIK